MRTFTIFSTLVALTFSAIASTIPSSISYAPGVTIHDSLPVKDLGAKLHVKARDTEPTFANIIGTLMSEVSEPANSLEYITAADYTMSTVGTSLDNMNQAFSKATASLNTLDEQDIATIFQTVNDPTASLSSSQVADLVGNVLKVALSAIGNANSMATASQLASTLPALLSLAANIAACR